MGISASPAPDRGYVASAAGQINAAEITEKTAAAVIRRPVKTEWYQTGKK